jgi:RNA polymerase sigma-70 factor (ECF subfamily)
MDDDELVRCCLNGCGWAFDELVKRYRDRVYGVALHLLGDRDLAEDLAQEAFLRAFQKLELFDSTKGSFSVWLVALTTRLCLNALKRRNLERRLFAGQEDAEAIEPSDNTCSFEEWLAMERREVIRNLLLSLPPMQRAALLLRYGEDMSIHDIAQVLRVPVGTVKVWLFRGRETLRRRLKEVGLL